MTRKVLLSVLVVGAVASFAGASLLSGWTAFGVRFEEARSLRLAGSGSLPSLDNAAPGAASESSISVSDSGTATGTLLLEMRSDTAASLRAQMALTVRREGDRVVYAGPLRAVLRLGLGRIAPGEQRRLRLRVAFSRDAANGVQGHRLRLAARWLAVQV